MYWSAIQNTLVNISFVLLLISLLAYWASIAFPKLILLRRIGRFTTIIINLLLGVFLGSRWVTDGYFPLSNLYESLIFLTWSLTFVQTLLEKQINNQLLGAIGIPIELCVIAFASLSLPKEMQQANTLVPALRSNWLMMHVTIMMLSYSFLILGSLLSVLFLIIAQGQNIGIRGNANGYILSSNTTYKKISSKQGPIEDTISIRSHIKDKDIVPQRMDLLESIDNLSYRIIGLGFPLLTVGIISGAVWANEAWGSYWSWDPKETWALITWLIFASYLHSRLTKSWQGKKPAILASIGFLVVWICYLGVNFLGKGLHSYGWLS
uniref:Cytochrome c biogenesis protein CcsA n=1 Tax=Balbiania investiens TaxID=111861 RepID=A0A4D6BLU9_9FLOR|nr:cytochrome c biogenesis protein [Balbiania investiens]QBX88700.1 cytochrome c biogenesis protein [Balbiania investiens]